MGGFAEREDVKELAVKTTQRYTVDGVTYDSLDEMPPEAREKWDSMAPFLTATGSFTSTNIRPGQRTTVRFERTTVHGGSNSHDGPWRGDESGWSDSFGSGSLDGTSALKAKRISMVFCIIFFPMFGLDGLAMFSRVKITAQFGPGWFIAYAVWILGLGACAWGLRERLRRQFFPKNDATPAKVLGTSLAGLLGVGLLAGDAVFGGAPIVAHYVTASPGQLTVTVTGKEADYQRYACSPRLDIKEFTFSKSQHLCPSASAFSEIHVGSKIRLEGRVSPFGVTVDRYYWRRGN